MLAGTAARVREVTYHYEDGLVDFVKHLNGRKGEAHRSIISFEAEAESTERAGVPMSLEVAMQWNTSFSESVYTFANTINTHEGGTHEEGFRAALTTLVNKFARDWGILKEKDPNLTGEDVREGLTAIVSIKLGEPQFEGQTKTKLGNTEAKAFVQKLVFEQLGGWFEANPSEGKDIARKSSAAAAARIAARKARDLARNRKGLLGGGGLPGKLSDCQSTNPEECEVFIVEGDSAGGSAKGGRDPRTQAILPIRGQDPQRREGPHRQGARQQRGPGADLGTRHRHPRRLRPRQAALSQDRADGRRRRRRPAHPHPAAHVAVPLHAPARRGRPRLPRPAAALPAALVQRRPRVRLQRPRARRDDDGRAWPQDASCPRRTPSSATRASAR